MISTPQGPIRSRRYASDLTSMVPRPVRARRYASQWQGEGVGQDMVTIDGTSPHFKFGWFYAAVTAATPATYTISVYTWAWWEGR